MEKELQRMHVLGITARDLKTNEVQKNVFVFDNEHTCKTFALLVKLVVHPPHKFNVTLEVTETDLVTREKVSNLLEKTKEMAEKINA